VADIVDPRLCALIRSNVEAVSARPDGLQTLSKAFYANLFARHPETRQYFPAAMGEQRERILHAVVHVVDRLSRPETVVPFLEQLGRDHRKYGIELWQYKALTEALIDAVAQAAGDDWTTELDDAWHHALHLVATTMTEAAAAETGPAAWVGTVVEHRRPLDDVAVVRLRLDQPMAYEPGQYVSVQVPGRPRMWRYLSPATPPDADGAVEFHVRRVSGGWVSPYIVSHARVGETWVLGSPIGALGAETMRPGPGRPRPLLMIASGTAIAPMRAQLMALARRPATRAVTVFYAGRYPCDLYDLPTLWHLARTNPWLTVVPVTESPTDPWWFTGPTDPPAGLSLLEGPVSRCVAEAGDWSGHDVQIAGSPAMIQATKFRLQATGVPADRIRHDPLY
jgi:NAD(P)H-flavin reductase/hemoglobin-like flavoprotein